MMNYFSSKKKWMAYLILLTFVFTCIVPTNLAGGNSAWADTVANNQQQIVNAGGYNPPIVPPDTEPEPNADGVLISKTIAPTTNENYFDITLEVQTQDKIEDIISAQDMAVVVIMDISWSMINIDNMLTASEDETLTSYEADDKKNYGDNPSERTIQYLRGINSKLAYKTQYAMAKAAADEFIDAYKVAAVENPSASRALSFVTFNTNAETAVNWTKFDSNTNATTIKNAYHTKATNTFGTDIDGKKDPVNGIYYAKADVKGGYYCDYYNDETKRQNQYTNIEGALRLAKNLLAQREEENKFVILLTDGFPTTYSVASDYSKTDVIKGYSPRMSDKGYSFTTVVNNKDKDGYFYDAVTGKVCWYGTSYSDTGAVRARKVATGIKQDDTKIYSVGVNVTGQSIDGCARDGSYSVVQCAGNSYETKSVSESGLTLYEAWLKKSIGSNTYYRGDDYTALSNAFAKILENMKSQSGSSAEASWVVEDPMNEKEMPQNIEFLNFYTKTGEKANPATSLSGSATVEAENTATFDVGKDAISWDLKKSGYTKDTETKGNEEITTYTYMLKYRVRLENENKTGFTEETPYNTNGKTTLTYVVRDLEDKITPREPLEFPIPVVKGYLGELSFTKIDSTTNAPIPGVAFTLAHAANCSVCKAASGSIEDDFVANEFVEIADMNATSTEKGLVSFTNIPSGHDYELTETVPEGYTDTKTTYPVKVAYDKVYFDGAEVTEVFPIANTPINTNLSVIKTWDDVNNQDGFRPESINVQLQRYVGEEANWDDSANVQVVENVTLTEKEHLLPGTTNQWKYTWASKPTQQNGQKVWYRVVELDTEDNIVILNGEYDANYNMTEYLVNGTTTLITNKHIPGKTSVSGSKTWIDGNNMDGTRPDSITINLFANDVKIESKTVTAKDNWSYLFDGLNEKENGKKIVYTVKEEPVSGYNSEQDGNNFINTIKQEDVFVKGTKSWGDKETNNHENDVVKIDLFRDGVLYKTTETSLKVDWKYSFDNLPKYAIETVTDLNGIAPDGHPFEYQAREQIPAGYIPSYDTKAENGGYVVNITNNLRDEKTPLNISGEKIWKDGEGQSVEIELFGNGTKVATTSTAYDYDLKAWTYKFDNLPKYDSEGKWITYTVKEVPVDGYISTVIPTEDGFDIVNTSYVENQGQIAVKKVVTGENTPPEGTEFDFNLKIKAELDLTEFDAVVAKEAKVLKDAHDKALNKQGIANDNLAKAKTAFETSAFMTTASAYQFILVDGSKAGSFAAVTSPSAMVYNVNGERVGVGNEEADKTVLDSVLAMIEKLADSFSSLYNQASFLHQLAEGPVQTTSPSALAFGFTETDNLLQAYAEKRAADRLEAAAKLAMDNYDVTTPTAINIIWNDNGTNKTVTMNPENDLQNDGWYYLNFKLFNDETNSFELKATTGSMITFAITESRPTQDNYTGTEITVKDDVTIMDTISGLFTDVWTLTTESSYGFTFENKYEDDSNDNPPPGKTTISRTVEKIWNDNNNPDRPTSITVQLLRNGEVVETVTLSAANGWSYNWPELDAGYTWSVKEVNVAEGYKASVAKSGTTFIITNTYSTPEENIPDENVPTGSVEPGEPLDELEDPEIPLGDAPATGDTNNAAPFMALLLAAIAGLVITRRKFN